MEIRTRYDFHLLGDPSREARLQLDQPIRRYQLMRTDYTVIDGVTISAEPVPLPLIVQRSQMERIEKMRRKNIRISGRDPLLPLIKVAEQRMQENPYVKLRRQLRHSR